MYFKATFVTYQHLAHHKILKLHNTKLSIDTIDTRSEILTHCADTAHSENKTNREVGIALLGEISI